MEFQFLPAVIAGLIAGVIMEMPVYLQKALGLDVKQDIFRPWGAMFKLDGAPMYIVGFLFHQVLAAAIALIYALGFTSSVPTIISGCGARWEGSSTI